MSKIKIEKLELSIPKEKFPLKSDLIIGYTLPELKLQEDECSWCPYAACPTCDIYSRKSFAWNLTDVYVCDSYGWIDELEELCIQNNGTLVAEETNEEGEKRYIRIRAGIRKRIKIIEE